MNIKCQKLLGGIVYESHTEGLKEEIGYELQSILGDPQISNSLICNVANHIKEDNESGKGYIMMNLDIISRHSKYPQYRHVCEIIRKNTVKNISDTFNKSNLELEPEKIDFNIGLKIMDTYNGEGKSIRIIIKDSKGRYPEDPECEESFKYQISMNLGEN